MADDFSNMERKCKESKNFIPSKHVDQVLKAKDKHFQIGKISSSVGHPLKKKFSSQEISGKTLARGIVVNIESL